MGKIINIHVNWLILLIITIVLLTLAAEHIFRYKWDQNATLIEERPSTNNSDVINEESIGEVKQQNYTNVDNTTWRCEDSDFIGNTTITSVALLKVHKTGSTTFGSILYRFGIRRGLSFVMPKGKRNFQYWPNTIDKVYRSFYPACKQNKYDILNIHSRYNGRDVLTKYMHTDTYVIATLRHPMDQMISAMNFYGLVNRLKRMGKTIEDFLDHPNILTDKGPMVWKLVWNSMSYDIGLNEFNLPKNVKKSDFESKSVYMKEIDRFLNWTEDNIDFFMISEKFDESLILLKDRLGWRIEDMIYFSLNTAASPPERNNVDTDTLLIKTKEFSYIDYLLYERMKVKLDRMIEEKGDELEVEVSKLRSLNKEFSEYCLERVEVDSSLLGAVDILSNKLKNEHKDNRCCVDTATNEMDFLNNVKTYMRNSCKF